jgi:tetratricopeptide (TPR) repeat protein
VELLDAALDQADRSVPESVRGAALSAVGYLLFRRGETWKARVRLREALQMADITASASLRADALRTLAWVADRRGHHDEAVELAGEAVEAAIESGESHLIARAHEVRGAALQHRDPDGARFAYAEALRYSRAAKHAIGPATYLNNLAILELEQGDYRAAQRLFGEARVITEEIRDASLLPFIDYGIGVTAALEGDMRVAEPVLTDAWQGARLTGQRSLLAYALLGLGVVRVSTGRVEQGALLLGASSALFEELGDQPEKVEATLYCEAVESARAHLGAATDDIMDKGRSLPAVELANLVVGDGWSSRSEVHMSL